MLVGAARQEVALAREIRARELVAGTSPADVAAAILAECAPSYGTTRIRAYRLALGIALADVVAQVRAWYQAEGRRVPRFSETLLSAYEGGQKRPGPEYLHYVCSVYRADPPDLGFEGPCLCGRSHRPATAARLRASSSGADSRETPPDPPPSAAGPVVPGQAASDRVVPDRVVPSQAGPGQGVPGQGVPDRAAPGRAASAGAAAPGRATPAGHAAATAEQTAGLAGAAAPGQAAGPGAPGLTSTGPAPGVPGPAGAGAGAPGHGASGPAVPIPRSAGTNSAGTRPAGSGSAGTRSAGTGPARHRAPAPAVPQVAVPRVAAQRSAGPDPVAVPGQDGQTGQAGRAGRADTGPPVAERAPAESEDDLRRMLIRLMADAGARVDCEFLGAVDRMRRQMDDALLSGTVSATMIDQWEETTAGYGRRYMTVPSLRLLCDALLDFGDVRRMCAERQPLEFAERLCRVAGQLAGLAGIIMLDLGDQRLARSFFRTARTATDETGDRTLRAWVAVREALVPLYYGDPREAASLASSAIDLAGRRPCVAGVMGPVVEARAQARLARLARRSGRGLRDALDRARGALDRSHDALAELSAEETGDTALGYTERQFYFHTGDTLAMLGDHTEAQRAYSRALRLYPAAEVLDATLVVFGQARCLADADEPEQALRLGQGRLLALPAEQRTEIVLQAARDLGRAVSARHPDLLAARDYEQALAAASPNR